MYSNYLITGETEDGKRFKIRTRSRSKAMNKKLFCGSVYDIGRVNGKIATTKTRTLLRRVNRPYKEMPIPQ